MLGKDPQKTRVRLLATVVYEGRIYTKGSTQVFPSSYASILMSRALAEDTNAKKNKD